MFSFSKRKSQIEARDFIRRLVDQTSPSVPPLEGEFRSENRANRTIPTLLTPWEDAQPVVDESTYALTKDFSDRGISLVLHQPLKAEQVVVGFWLESPCFILGNVRQNVPLGGGFWQLGVELGALLDPARFPQIQPLLPLTTRLLPRPRQEGKAEGGRRNAEC